MFHSATENNKMALKYVILISLGVYVLIHNLLFTFTNECTSFNQIFHFKRRFGQIMYLFHKRKKKKTKYILRTFQNDTNEIRDISGFQ